MKEFKVTSWGNIEIADTMSGTEDVRMLFVDSGQESICYLNPLLHNELIFPYTKVFAQIAFLAPSREHVLMLGGGAFSFPKYFISHFPEGSMDVVELYREIYEIALDYFFLDELFEQYHLKENGRLKVHIDDACHYVRICKDRYDLIYNDAYHGIKPDFPTLSYETTAAIKKCLTPSGIYVINLIGSLAGTMSMQTILSRKLLETLFANVSVNQVEPKRSPEQRQNLILLASDGPLPDVSRGVLRREIVIDDAFD